eukprot:Awhi_evm1s11054
MSLLQELKIKHPVVTIKHHHSNGMVERLIRTLKNWILKSHWQENFQTSNVGDKVWRRNDEDFRNDLASSWNRKEYRVIK